MSEEHPLQSYINGKMFGPGAMHNSGNPSFTLMGMNDARQEQERLQQQASQNSSGGGSMSDRDVMGCTSVMAIGAVVFFFGAAGVIPFPHRAEPTPELPPGIVKAMTTEAVRVCNIPIKVPLQHLKYDRVVCRVIEQGQEVLVANDPNSFQMTVFEKDGNTLKTIGWGSYRSFWDKEKSASPPYKNKEVQVGIPVEMKRLNLMSTHGVVSGHFYPFVRDGATGSKVNVSPDSIDFVNQLVAVDGCLAQYCQVTAELPGYKKTSGAISRDTLKLQ